jgi:DNA repair ATPase RecN
MTDNIVTRLRAAHEQSAKYPRLLLGELEALNEAADEIERLQAEVYRLTRLANLWEAEFNAAVNALTTDRNPTK